MDTYWMCSKKSQVWSRIKKHTLSLLAGLVVVAVVAALVPAQADGQLYPWEILENLAAAAERARQAAEQARQAEEQARLAAEVKAERDHERMKQPPLAPVMVSAFIESAGSARIQWKTPAEAADWRTIVDWLEVERSINLNTVYFKGPSPWEIVSPRFPPDVIEFSNSGGIPDGSGYRVCAGNFKGRTCSPAMVAWPHPVQVQTVWPMVFIKHPKEGTPSSMTATSGDAAGHVDVTLKFTGTHLTSAHYSSDNNPWIDAGPLEITADTARVRIPTSAFLQSQRKVDVGLKNSVSESIATVLVLDHPPTDKTVGGLLGPDGRHVVPFTPSPTPPAGVPSTAPAYPTPPPKQKAIRIQ